MFECILYVPVGLTGRTFRKQFLGPWMPRVGERPGGALWGTVCIGVTEAGVRLSLPRESGQNERIMGWMRT